MILYSMILIFQIGCKALTLKSSKKEKNIEVVSQKVTGKNPVLSKDQKIEKYLSEFAPIAIEEMKKYKIPASITLAQGLLESGYGEGRLAVKGNNHFGIKCHKEWVVKKFIMMMTKKGNVFVNTKTQKNLIVITHCFYNETSLYFYLIIISKITSNGHMD